MRVTEAVKRNQIYKFMFQAAAFFRWDAAVSIRDVTFIWLTLEWIIDAFLFLEG
jgi:hypothetical protein